MKPEVGQKVKVFYKHANGGRPFAGEAVIDDMKGQIVVRYKNGTWDSLEDVELEYI